MIIQLNSFKMVWLFSQNVVSNGSDTIILTHDTCHFSQGLLVWPNHSDD